MAQAAQMNVLEISSPIRVEHDKKRRQFSIRLNGKEAEVELVASAGWATGLPENSFTRGCVLPLFA